MFLKVGNDMASGNNDQKGGAAGDSANDQGQEDIWASVVQRKVKRVRILFFFLWITGGSTRLTSLLLLVLQASTLLHPASVLIENSYSARLPTSSIREKIAYIATIQGCLISYRNIYLSHKDME